MQFWLGTHKAVWLARTDQPLMVSHRTLVGRRSFPKATCPWVLDSGGFTELTMFGRWRTTTDQYLVAAERYRAKIGNLVWAAPQDWMVEPWMLTRTGLTVDDHQHRTVDNFVELTSRSTVPFIPVLQGWTRADYLTHVAMYERAGVDLAAAPVVGIGSVCRRASENDIVDIIEELHELGIKLHGFGVKRQALKVGGYMLESADSMAWSYDARRMPPLEGCPHKSCSNCLRYALAWRDATVKIMEYQQPRLVFG